MEQHNAGYHKVRPQQQPQRKRNDLAGYQVVLEATGIRRYPRPGELYLFVPHGTFGTAYVNTRMHGSPTDYVIFTIACQSSEELTKVFSL